jgi:hypothetical protein
MLFWPVVIALGPGFVALYYDHDVKSFADQNVCEQTPAAQRAFRLIFPRRRRNAMRKRPRTAFVPPSVANKRTRGLDESFGSKCVPRDNLPAAKRAVFRSDL